MIIHLNGPSESGKDTAATFLKSHLKDLGYEAVEIKFSRAIKSCLEHLYNLPEGILDTPEGKSLPVPGLGHMTFLDVLILAWSDSQTTIFGQLWLTYGANKISEALQDNKIVILSDIRQRYEFMLLYNNPLFMGHYNQILLEGRGTYLDSDKDVLEFGVELAKKSGKPPLTIYNTGTKEDFSRCLRAYLNLFFKIA